MGNANLSCTGRLMCWPTHGIWVKSSLSAVYTLPSSLGCTLSGNPPAPLLALHLQQSASDFVICSGENQTRLSQDFQQRLYTSKTNMGCCTWLFDAPVPFIVQTSIIKFSCALLEHLHNDCLRGTEVGLGQEPKKWISTILTHCLLTQRRQ